MQACKSVKKNCWKNIENRLYATITTKEIDIDERVFAEIHNS